VKLRRTSGSDEPAEPQTEDTSAQAGNDDEQDGAPRGGATTPGKGRPTPKRRDAERARRGPVAPPPTTRAEARARKKELKNKLSKSERKELAAEQRARRSEQREKMMAGDEKYMIARDRGPVRALARDIVDSRRNFAGLFMPFAVLLIVAMLMPNMAFFINIAMLLFVVLMVIDSIILGRLVNKRVRERYPDTTDTGFRLGFYAFTRAMQLRMMRAPRPRVSVGEAV